MDHRHPLDGAERGGMIVATLLIALSGSDALITTPKNRCFPPFIFPGNILGGRRGSAGGGQTAHPRQRTKGRSSIRVV